MPRSVTPEIKWVPPYFQGPYLFTYLLLDLARVKVLDGFDFVVSKVKSIRS